MYTLVLMTALTTSADVPAWGRRCHSGSCCSSDCAAFSPVYYPCEIPVLGPAPAPVTPRRPETPPEGGGKRSTTGPSRGDKDEESRRDGNVPANIIVLLPGDAKLSFGTHVMKSTSERRQFITPPLARGQDHYYTLKAEMIRDGKPVVKTQRFAIRAGQELQVVFDDRPVTQVAQK
jgi:uncharacterized protein (TIGR03000 family)